MRSKVLITGGSGLLGLNWACALRSTHDVTLGIHSRQVDIQSVQTEKFSLESLSEILKVLDRVNPEFLIHTAGLTSVEKCEENPELAYHINVKLAENVAKACANRKVKLVHISTDHVFNGNIIFPSEDEVVNPLNIYGKSKAEAEKKVQNLFPEALVIRTNFFGWGPVYRQSFSDWIIKNLKYSQSIKLFSDIFYTPIYATQLVLIVQKLIDSSASGVFHIVGDERLSKYEFGLQLATIFDLDTTLIHKSSIDAESELVRRPYDMSLSNFKVSKLLGISVGSVKDHLLMLRSQSNLLEEFQSL